MVSSSHVIVYILHSALKLLATKYMVRVKVNGVAIPDERICNGDAASWRCSIRVMKRFSLLADVATIYPMCDCFVAYTGTVMGDAHNRRAVSKCRAS